VAVLLSQENKHAASCFHSHQCIEKGLKALLYHLGIHFEVNTHQLENLLIIVKTSGVDPFQGKDLSKEISALDKDFSFSRDPDAWEPCCAPHTQYSNEDSEIGISVSNLITEFISSQLSS